LNEAGKILAKRIPKRSVARGQCKTRVTVITPLYGNDPETARCPTRSLDRNVHGLSAGNAEDNPWKHVVERCGQSRGELRALAGHEVMVTDVELSKSLHNCTGDSRIAMPKTEDAAIAMTVDQAEFRVRIFEPNALTPPHHDLKAHTLVVRKLVGCDVLAKHGGKLVEGFKRLRGRTLGHGASLPELAFVFFGDQHQHWRNGCATAYCRRSFCASSCRKVAKMVTKAAAWQ
jgi:hypothetical protein